MLSTLQRGYKINPIIHVCISSISDNFDVEDKTAEASASLLG